MTSPSPRESDSQESSPLEDPDEGVRTTNRCVVLHRSKAKGGENSVFELSFKTLKYILKKLARAYHHKHTALHNYHTM